MAIYHCSVKTFSRSKGHSAVAAAAYRARANIADEALGKVHRYARRKGLLKSEIILPPGAPDWAKDQETLWNTVEKTEKRKNSTVAREFEIALPCELNHPEKILLAQELSRWLVERFGFAVQYGLHAPDEDDSLNYHVHILASTRKLEAEGFTEKTRELDAIMAAKDEDGHCYNPAILEVRKMVADVTNKHLAKAGFDIRVDHRSLIDQQQEAVEKNDVRTVVHLAREPTIKVYHGPKEEEAKQTNIEIKEANRNEQRSFVDRLKIAADPKAIAKRLRVKHYTQKFKKFAFDLYQTCKEHLDALDEVENYLKVNATPWQRQALRLDDRQYQSIFEEEPRLLDAPADLDELIMFIRRCNVAQQLEDFGLKPLPESRTTEIEPPRPQPRL